MRAFPTQADRTAYSISAIEAAEGQLFTVVADGSVWKSIGEGVGNVCWAFLSGPQFDRAGEYDGAPYALTDGASIAIDCNDGRTQKITFSDRTVDNRRTFAAPTNLITGNTYRFILQQGSTGRSGKLLFSSAWKFFVPFEAVNEAGAVQILDCYYDGTYLSVLSVVSGSPTAVTPPRVRGERSSSRDNAEGRGNGR